MTVALMKTAKKTRCVYCLCETETAVFDNALGRTWQWSASGQADTGWQVPSCPKCASKYEKMEHDFLVKIGRLFAPVELQLLGIPTAVEDFIVAKTDEIRKGITEKSELDEILFRQIVRGAAVEKKLIKRVKAAGTYDPVIDIKRLVARAVRGLVYAMKSVYIDSDHRLEIYFKHELNAQPVLEALDSMGAESYCGHGMKIMASFAQDDAQSGIFVVDIWERLRLYAFAK